MGEGQRTEKDRGGMGREGGRSKTDTSSGAQSSALVPFPAFVGDEASPRERTWREKEERGERREERENERRVERT